MQPLKTEDLSFPNGRFHREPQSQDAWRRMLAFFAHHL
jgi:hypothetical protein